MSSVHVGGCLCGAVRYAARDAMFLCFCHCASCRRASGAVLVAWGTFRAEDFQVTQGHLKLVATSPGVLRGHCQHCGTQLTYQNVARKGEIDVTLATLDEPVLRPIAHIWVADKLPWLEIDDGLPQYRHTVSGA